MIAIPTDTGNYLPKGIQILADWAHGQRFDSAEVESKRGVVTEEWRLRRGAGARMQDKQFPVLLKGSRYAERLPIGSAEYLHTFPQSALRRFYEEWYRPELMAVIVVGDVDKDAVERMIREEFSKIPATANPTPRPTFAVPTHDSTYISIATDHEAMNSSFVLYSLLPPRDQSTVASFRERFVWRLATSMLNTRLSDIAQKANPPFTASGLGRGYFLRSADVFTIFGGVRPGGVVTGLDAVLTEAERVSRFGFTQTELDRVKTAQLRGSEQSYAERDRHFSGAYADELVRNFLQGEDVLGTAGEYDMYKRLSPGVTLDEVNASMRSLLAAKNRVLLVNAPDDAKATLPTEAQLIATMNAVKTKTLEPYKDVVASGALLAKAPVAGKIVSERAIPEIGVTEWKLSNGATVVLKPTDYAGDQIVFSGTSPGGTSLVPDSMFVSAMMASMAASVGGVGNLSATDLRKVLTGKIASANVSIGSRNETVNGSASPKDVETMFQLVYLRFTAPRVDSIAFNSARQSMQASMANQAASPMSAFQDTVMATMTQHAFRARPMSPSLLDEAKIDKTFAAYRDRFADASDFTFFLVGTFTVDPMRPLVQTYLASLPALNRHEVAKDDGIRPPKGVIEKTVRRGVEPQSQTVISFTAPYEYSAANAYVLTSLGELMTNRLIDRLREALGGTYSANALASGDRDASKLATVTIRFGSSPDRAEELTKAIFTLIDSVQTFGPTPADVEKVQAAQRRVRETSLRQNGFWASNLSSAYRYGEDPRDILKYDALVSGLTPDAIKNAAKMYLKKDNYVRVTLLPEPKKP